MMNFLQKLFGSNKFRLAFAAVIVWVVSMVGWDASPGPIEAFLAAVAAWLGAAGAFLEAAKARVSAELKEERRAHALDLRAANDALGLQSEIAGALSRATSAELKAELARRGRS